MGKFGGVALSIVGVCCAAYGTLGALFVSGGVLAGERGVGWAAVVVLAIIALLGVKLFFVGSKLTTGNKPTKGPPDAQQK